VGRLLVVADGPAHSAGPSARRLRLPEVRQDREEEAGSWQSTTCRVGYRPCCGRWVRRERRERGGRSWLAVSQHTPGRIARRRAPTGVRVGAAAASCAGWASGVVGESKSIAMTTGWTVSLFCSRTRSALPFGRHKSVASVGDDSDISANICSSSWALRRATCDSGRDILSSAAPRSPRPRSDPGSRVERLAHDRGQLSPGRRGDPRSGDHTCPEKYAASAAADVPRSVPVGRGSRVRQPPRPLLVRIL
jgi:hypothetical protein